MAGEQLERSILERKERDELHSIAAAMSLEPRPRSRKAEIIDLILQATGVTAEAAPAGNGNGHGGQASSEPAEVPEAPASEQTAPSPRRRTTRRATAVSSGNGAAVASAPERTPEHVVAEAMPQTGIQAEPASAGETTAAALIEVSSPTVTEEPAERAREERSEVVPVERPERFGGQHHGPAVEPGNRRSRRRRGRDRDRGEAQGSVEQPWQGELVPVKGLLDLREEGYGFLRTSGYHASQRDVYVSVSQVRRFALRKGDAIEGACRPAGASEKYPALIRIDSVSGMPPEEARSRPKFEDLTPLFPDEPLRLELPGDPANLTARIIDLIAPVGKGQRGMIVSPPKAGKTTVMKQIAHSIEANNPDVHLIVLLVDERPEEVTDMRRSVRGEVIASTFDRPADEHIQVAELTIERAKRLVEQGRDVVIILDGITRLARAYNLGQPATGRIMSGGVDSGALYPPKRFFGAARNIEEGGSLTILATALVETGSKMDEVIFEEFKGTGNMELRLDRRLAERRLYPAIDVNASSTRHEELLFDRSQLQQVWKLRRVLNALANEGSAAAGLELLIDKIRSTRSNDEFLAEIAKAPVPNN
jgi:transcription termination factor Rho